MSTFGERIKSIRQSKGMSQEEFAKFLGTSKQVISRYETNQRIPKLSVATEYSKLLNIPLSELVDNAPTTQRKRHLIPVLGYVRAGIPIEAVEEILDYEEIDEKTASNGEYFGLRINGNSMYPELKENDVVIVRKQSSADTGNIVIALINGDDACCKKLIKHDNGIALQSINPVYEPMFFSNEDIQTKPVSIIGKVIEHRRKY